jgi:UDP-N-acetylglucosamine 2-epimerase (non-hydrolysing)
VLAGATSIASELRIPIVFSAHPRTQERIDALGLELDDQWLRRHPPFDFFDFVALEREALCVLTDSGTVQEECCIFGVPAVTVRDTTERPETIECGSNILSGTDPDAIARCVRMAVGRDHGSWQPPSEYLVPQVSPTVAAIVTGRIERQSPVVGESPATVAGAGPSQA